MEWEVIDNYDVKQAVQDGLLVPFPGPILPSGHQVNLVSRGLYHALVREMPGGLVDVTRLIEALIRLARKGQVDEGWVLGEYQGLKIWAVPNGTVAPSGYPGATAMLPEDR
jgi:hypothetical protein